MSERTHLARDGGPKVRSEPFPARGHIGAEEKSAVDAFMAGVVESGVLPPMTAQRSAPIAPNLRRG